MSSLSAAAHLQALGISSADVQDPYHSGGGAGASPGASLEEKDEARSSTSSLAGNDEHSAGHVPAGGIRNLRIDGLDLRTCTYRLRKTLRIGRRSATSKAAAVVATVGVDVTAPLPERARNALERTFRKHVGGDVSEVSNEVLPPLSVRPAFSASFPLGPSPPPPPPPGTPKSQRRRRRKVPLNEGMTATVSNTMVEVRKPIRADGLGYLNSNLTLRLGHQWGTGKPIFACDVAPDKPELSAAVAVGAFLCGGLQRYARGEVPIDWLHVAIPLGSTRSGRIPTVIAPRIPMTIRRGNPLTDPEDDSHLVLRATGLELAISIPA